MQKLYRILSVYISFAIIFHSNFIILCKSRTALEPYLVSFTKKLNNLAYVASLSKEKVRSLATSKVSLASSDDIGLLALQYTNEFRAKNGLKSLIWNQKLADLSLEHSKNMAEGKVPFGHGGFYNRVARFSPSHRSAAENVFMTSSGRAVARDAVNGWIDSSGHRKNLLGNYNACGIGAYKGQRGWYVTQLFALFI